MGRKEKRRKMFGVNKIRDLFSAFFWTKQKQQVWKTPHRKAWTARLSERNTTRLLNPINKKGSNKCDGQMFNLWAFCLMVFRMFHHYVAKERTAIEWNMSNQCQHHMFNSVWPMLLCHFESGEVFDHFGTRRGWVLFSTLNKRPPKK